MAGFLSPGAEVSNTLSDILASKKLEARQKMLDILNQQNVQSEISARNENAASQKANREALASDRAAQEDQRRLSTFDTGNHPVGEDLSSVPSDLQTSLINAGRAKRGPAPEAEGPVAALNMPQVSAQLTGPSTPAQMGEMDRALTSSPADLTTTPVSPAVPLNAPPSVTNLGTAAQAKQERIKHNVGDFMQKMSQNPTMSPMDKLLGLTQAFEETTPPASSVAELLKTQPKQYQVGPNGQLTELKVEPGSHVINAPRPPAPQHSRATYVGTNPADGTALSYDPDLKKVIDSKGNEYTGPMGAKPSSPPHNTSNIPPALRTQLIGGFQNYVKNRTPENKATYDKIVSNVLQSLPATYSPDVKEGLGQLYAAYAGQPWNTVVTKIQTAPGQPPMTPAESAQMQELWNAINAPSEAQ
jgi:hypothetical protein